ncbi:MAG: FG-GAP repeat domain-containing protein, partial [Limisphaerales bacterium]
DRTKPWKVITHKHEPTVHRMHWIKSTGDSYSFVVKPLHGRGNKGGVGKGGLVWEYHAQGAKTGDVKRTLVSDFMHLTHNFHFVNWDQDPEEELLLGGKEGVFHFDKRKGKWHKQQLTDKAAGEIRDGRLPNGQRFIVTIEPHHGIAATVYVETKQGLWKSTNVLDNELVAGHALQVAELTGDGKDDIVVGWRGQGRKGKPGINLFSPANKNGTKWDEQKISGDEVAVEDLKVADLNGDGKIDIIAAGRQTKNLVIFWNQ